MANADLLHELTRRWNAGDFDGVLELYAEDAVMRTGPSWPEQASYEGREAIRASIEDWRGVWETVEAELHEVEEHGDKLIGMGRWRMRSGASGVGGEMPIFMLVTVRDGKIAVLEWVEDRDSALAAIYGA